MTQAMCVCVCVCVCARVWRGGRGRRGVWQREKRERGGRPPPLFARLSSDFFSQAACTRTTPITSPPAAWPASL